MSFCEHDIPRRHTTAYCDDDDATPSNDARGGSVELTHGLTTGVTGSPLPQRPCLWANLSPLCGDKDDTVPNGSGAGVPDDDMPADDLAPDDDDGLEDQRDKTAEAFVRATQAFAKQLASEFDLAENEDAREEAVRLLAKDMEEDSAATMDAATEIASASNRVNEDAGLRNGLAEVLQKAWPKRLRKTLSSAIATREDLVSIGNDALTAAGVFRRVRVLLAAVQRFSNMSAFVNIRPTKQKQRHSQNVLRTSKRGKGTK